MSGSSDLLRIFGKAKVLFSSGLSAGAVGIFNTTWEIGVIFDILIYLFSSRRASLTNNFLPVAGFAFI